MAVINGLHGLHIKLKEILYVYTFKRHNLGKYYFVANTRPLQLVVNLHNLSKNKPQGNIVIFGASGCEKELMLKEYKINMDLESGQKCGPQASSLVPLCLIFSLSCSLISLVMVCRFSGMCEGGG